MGSVALAAKRRLVSEIARAQVINDRRSRPWEFRRPTPGILVVGPRFVIRIALTNAISCRLTALDQAAKIKYKPYAARRSPEHFVPLRLP
jgi:hypothetical protein